MVLLCENNELYATFRDWILYSNKAWTDCQLLALRILNLCRPDMSQTGTVQSFGLDLKENCLGLMEQVNNTLFALNVLLYVQMLMITII